MYKWIVVCRSSRGDVVRYETLAVDESSARQAILSKYDVRVLDVYMVNA